MMRVNVQIHAGEHDHGECHGVVLRQDVDENDDAGDDCCRQKPDFAFGMLDVFRRDPGKNRVVV